MSLNEFITGGLIGISNLIIGYPFDTIKVNMQTNIQTNNQMNLFQTIQHIKSNYGIRGFYRGIGFPILTSPIQNALAHSSYYQAIKYFKYQHMLDQSKTNLSDRSESDSINYEYVLAASAYSSLICSFINCPSELFKIKLQTSNQTPNQTPSVKQTFRNILNSDGVKGLYVGLVPTFYRDMLITASQFLIYENIKKNLQKKSSLDNRLIIVIAGGTSGLVSTTIGFIPDTIKNIMQSSEKKHTMREAYKMATKNKGFIGLFNGYLPCIMSVAVIDSIGFLIFEHTKNSIK